MGNFKKLRVWQESINLSANIYHITRKEPFCKDYGLCNQIQRASSELGDYFMKELRTIPQIKEVRGRGLMIGIEFNSAIKALRKRLLFENHIFTGSSSEPNTLRILPPLNVTKTEIDYFIIHLKSQLT